MKETAALVEVIRTTHMTGTGKDGDPTRVEVAYWSTDGRLIAKMDINDDPYWQRHLR